MDVYIEPPNELIKLLSAHDDDQPKDAMTVTQIRKATGHGERKIRDMLRAMIEQGRIECVPIYIRSIHGQDVRSYGYRVLPDDN